MTDLICHQRGYLSMQSFVWNWSCTLVLAQVAPYGQVSMCCTLISALASATKSPCLQVWAQHASCDIVVLKCKQKEHPCRAREASVLAFRCVSGSGISLLVVSLRSPASPFCHADPQMMWCCWRQAGDLLAFLCGHLRLGYSNGAITDM